MSLSCLSAAIAVEAWQEGFPCPEDTGPGLPSFLALARPLAVAYPQQRSPASISSSRAARSFIWFWQMLCFCHKSQGCRRLRLHSSTSSSYNIKTGAQLPDCPGLRLGPKRLSNTWTGDFCHVQDRKVHPLLGILGQVQLLLWNLLSGTVPGPPRVAARSPETTQQFAARTTVVKITVTSLIPVSVSSIGDFFVDILIMFAQVLSNSVLYYFK